MVNSALVFLTVVETLVPVLRIAIKNIHQKTFPFEFERLEMTAIISRIAALAWLQKMLLLILATMGLPGASCILWVAFALAG